MRMKVTVLSAYVPVRVLVEQDADKNATTVHLPYPHISYCGQLPLLQKDSKHKASTCSSAPRVMPLCLNNDIKLRLCEGNTVSSYRVTFIV